ncbi:hypothetical protein [Vibrio splendidus]|uniref:hypothetical protein n=1 Tax=Vibrio splendidus TaxID=29497 RepID=UPI00076A3CF6|nr:hypothetical protein [Vibrio splendidus]PHX05512.1 hypothetical protein VSPL_29060 [Vibrio splendidus]
MGYGLIDVGRNQKNMSLNSMSKMVNQEQQRDATNKQIKQQKKQGVMAGAGAGATIGMSFGPVGAVAGAVIGGLAASLF